MLPADRLRQISRDLCGLPLSAAWTGGTSEFLSLELGEVYRHPRHDDGYPGQPDGEISIVVQSSWRLQKDNAVVCGSSADFGEVDKAISLLLDAGCYLMSVAMHSNLPELHLEFSEGYSFSTFNITMEGPNWTIQDRRGSAERYIQASGYMLLEGLPTKGGAKVTASLGERHQLGLVR